MKNKAIKQKGEKIRLRLVTLGVFLILNVLSGLESVQSELTKIQLKLAVGQLQLIMIHLGLVIVNLELITTFHPTSSFK